MRLTGGGERLTLGRSETAALLDVESATGSSGRQLRLGVNRDRAEHLIAAAAN